MPNEIQWTYTTGQSGYALLRSSSGTIWNGSSFESYTPANYATYRIPGSEQGSGGCYFADFPTGITTPGIYNVVVKQQITGSGAQSDFSIACGEIFWNGSAVIPAVDLRSGPLAISGAFVQVSGMATALQLEAYLPIRLTKNTAFSGFVFKMELSGKPGIGISGGNLTGQRTSGPTKGFANLAFTPVEISAGWFRTNFTAADVNDDAIGYKFTENSGRGTQRDFTVITQRSG